jgi:DNA-binding IclR family transcriptional regulator
MKFLLSELVVPFIGMVFGEGKGMTAQPVAKGSIARAARVLDALAESPQGASLAEIVARTAFTKTTTFRVLASLQQVHYVVQDPQNSKYRLGLKLAGLARSAAHTDIAALAARGLDRLAETSQDTVFLSVPEGAASICIARRVGDFPIQTLTLNTGDRRPLGVGAGALALYCALDAPQRDAICRVNRNWLAEYGFTQAMLKAEHAAFAKNGYSINQGKVVPGMSAVALPVLARNGQPVAAIAIGAISERMTRERIETLLLPALRRETARLAGHLYEIEKEHPQ